MKSARNVAKEAKELDEEAEELGSFPEYVLVFSGICSGSSAAAAAAAAAELESRALCPLLFLLGRDVRTKEAKKNRRSALN